MTTRLRRRLTLAAALCTVLLAVLDQNIVAAASLPIVTDLDPTHGLDRLPWLVSAYALASAAALPLYGKLCDTAGTKRVFLAAVAVFLLGSVLCGAATNMAWLIAFRALQGIGGGGLMSVTMVLMAELTEPGERAGRGAGIGGLVAGVGLVAGPLAGGQLADHLGWRWIFYVNVPLGLAILAVVALAAPTSARHRPHRIDYLGAALAALLACAVLLITDWGGDRYAWTSGPILALAALTAALLGLFLWRQRAAAEPILPLSLFRNPTFRVAMPVQALVGFGMIGAVVYTLLYLQVARDVPAGSSGLHLIPLALGMTVSGIAGGRAATGDRAPLLCGLTATTVAIALFGLLGTDTPYPLIWGVLALLGAGLGQVVGRLITITQQAVDARHLGVATTAIRFAQTLGGALGAALSGTILVQRFAAGSPTTDPAAIPALPPADRLAALQAFVSAIDTVFLTAGVVMAASVALALLFPPAGGPRGARSVSPAGRRT
ncbi:MFS transporter [Catenuloplanes atrovinosus]|uniref:EmrB/QacA subfamily drug resistance transporter n=1 Tax=Catenuloplanes atrovinosus TaxID=137266 RepID=A0AAE3YRP7_9ACTN|nr:MFS transporter [Catenuloplanes atrovinosus]MDR7278405.1 EmrB/QacA subfamily drug resistance transporter [Catenuloplanes atrovinosus]